MDLNNMQHTWMILAVRQKKEKFIVREFTHLLERDNPKKVVSSFLLCRYVSLWPSYSA